MKEKLERFKEYVNRVCGFPTDVVDEFANVRDDINTIDDITDDDWIKLMEVYKSSNIDWENDNEAYDKDGNELRVGDQVSFHDPKEHYWYANDSICKVLTVNPDGTIKLDGGYGKTNPEETCSLYKEYSPMFVKEGDEYGIRNMLQDIDNAKAMVSYVKDGELHNRLYAMIEWFDRQVKKEIIDHYENEAF